MPCSEDESDDSMDSRMSEYSNDSDSDGTSSSETSGSGGSFRRDFNSIHSKHVAKSRPVDSVESSLPVVGSLERTYSGYMVLTLGLFTNPSSYGRATEPIQFRSGESGAQIGARLECLAARTMFITKRRATSTRSRVRFTPQEDRMLTKLRESEKLSWEEIERNFPHRTRASLQVHCSTKLKSRTT